MAAEAAKTTVEQFTTASNVAFKEGVEKSLAALNELNANSKKNLEAIVASTTAATKGAEALGAQAVAYGKQTFEANISQARALTGARSVQEVVELQTAFAKTALEAYIGQLNAASETVSSALKDSLRPINERTSALVETFQGAR